MLRFLGITVGVLVQVLFAVTSYYNYVFLKGSPPCAGHCALAWDAFLAVQFGIVHSLLLLPSVKKRLVQFIAPAFYGLFFLYGRLLDPSLHNVAVASRRQGDLAASGFAALGCADLVFELLGNLVLQPVLLRIWVSYGLAPLVVLGSAKADSTPTLPASRCVFIDSPPRLYELSGIGVVHARHDD